MANSGFICQDAYLEKTKKLTDEQVGRLFRALMVYHTTGEITPLGQVEEIAFDFIREDIDKADAAYKAKCEQNRQNRLATTVNERQRTSTNVEVVQTIPKSEEPDKGFMLDDEAVSIQKDHNRVLDAAEDAGFKMSNNVRANLINLYAEHGLQKMLDGLTSCSEHSAPTLAYLRAVLKGESKKPMKTGKVLPAQDFKQRDYSEVQKQLEQEQHKHIVEMLCKNNGLWDEINGCPVEGWRAKLDQLEAEGRAAQ